MKAMRSTFRTLIIACAWLIITIASALVLMVFVVSVSMVVLERFMPMLVLVSLSQVQPDASSHQDGGTQKLKCQTIPQDQYGDQSSDKRRQ